MVLKDNSKRVLIGLPTSNHKQYCQKEFIENIKAFTYPNFFCLIVDNSLTDENFKLLKEMTKGDSRFEIVFRKNKNPKTPIRELIFDCTQYIYEYFFEKNFDIWFSLESDVFPPINCIEHMLAVGKHVIGLPYLHFQRKETRLLNSEIRTVRGIQFSEYLTPLQAICFVDGKVKKGFQTGIGCMMFSKAVLKRIKIRMGDKETNEIGLGSPPDYFIHSDLYAQNIPVYLDTRIIAIHRNSRDKWDKIEKSISS